MAAGKVGDGRGGQGGEELAGEGGNGGQRARCQHHCMCLLHHLNKKKRVFRGLCPDLVVTVSFVTLHYPDHLSMGPCNAPDMTLMLSHGACCAPKHDGCMWLFLAETCLLLNLYAGSPARDPCIPWFSHSLHSFADSSTHPPIHSY